LTQLGIDRREDQCKKKENELGGSMEEMKGGGSTGRPPRRRTVPGETAKRSLFRNDAGSSRGETEKNRRREFGGRGAVFPQKMVTVWGGKKGAFRLNSLRRKERKKKAKFLVRTWVLGRLPAEKLTGKTPWSQFGYLVAIRTRFFLCASLPTRGKRHVCAKPDI